MAFRRSPQQDPGLPFTRSLRAPTYSQFGSTSCRRCYPGRGVRALLFVWFSSKFVILCAMGMLCSLTEVSAQFSFFWASAVLVSEAPLPALLQLSALALPPPWSWGGRCHTQALPWRLGLKLWLFLCPHPAGDR